MTERQTKRTYESALPNTLADAILMTGKSYQPDKTPSLEDLTPAKYNRMSEKQRKELLNRLIDYLKSI
jgi:hypothetical protein